MKTLSSKVLHGVRVSFEYWTRNDKCKAIASYMIDDRQFGITNVFLTEKEAMKVFPNEVDCEIKINKGEDL